VDDDLVHFLAIDHVPVRHTLIPDTHIATLEA
jgi:hypothetical protein